eukprot:XP_016880984.1 uncharacterized protein LOC105371763 [Homo sapiens]
MGTKCHGQEGQKLCFWGRKWCANETRRKRKPSGVGAASSPSLGLSNGPEGEVAPPTPGTCETKRPVGWQKRNLNTLQPPPLGSRNRRARLRGNLPGGSRLGPRDRPDRSPQLRAGRCGPARSGPSSSATRASAPLGSGGGRGGPTIPFWLRGRAGRGERAEIIFCLVVSAPVPSPRDARDGRSPCPGVLMPHLQRDKPDFGEVKSLAESRTARVCVTP